MPNEIDPTKTCLNLRSKEMFYQVEEDEDAREHRKEVERLFGTHRDTRMYWCDSTQTGRGPDDEPVNCEACSCPTRKCFQSLHSLT